MSGFELYRFTHPDGSAKDWAFSDQGDGMAVIRWGPANQLRSRQEKPLAVARQRAQEKQRKGYRPLGRVRLDGRGRPLPSKPTTARVDTCRTTKPIDLTALLGPDPGFYF